MKVISLLSSLFLSAALGLGACDADDGTTVDAPSAVDLAGQRDMTVCMPLAGTSANQCSICSTGSQVACNSDQQGAECQYGDQYCVCADGRWDCAAELPTPDLASHD